MIPFLAYSVLLKLQQRTAGTFERLLWAIDQLARVALDDMLKCWNIEHLELSIAEPDALLH